ncbi:MAG: hypothetical protein ACRDLB_06280 [Actinomycetota bacterium]
MRRLRALLVVAGMTASLWLVGAPAHATECRKKVCPPPCQVNEEIYIDENGNVGWGGSGNPFDCYF